MLTHLKIENYALIKDLEISPSSGLNIITGETGAGKSIMLGAVGLLLGKRADVKALSDLGRKCIIEGEFNITSYDLERFFEEEDLDYEGISIIRREISPAGKSRAFVNDTPVTLDILKKLGVHLMDVHSQHDTLSLGENSFQLSLIDSFAGNQSLLLNYQKLYAEYKEQLFQISSLEQEITKLQSEHDYHQFLLKELTDVNLNRNEQELLEEELSVLDNAEEIKSGLYSALNLLSEGEQTVQSNLQEIKNIFQKLAALSPTYQETHSRLESTYIELKDISSEIEAATDDVVYDPVRIDFVKERLGIIYQLQQKHNVNTVLQLLKIENDLAQKIIKTSELDDELEALNNAANKVADQIRAEGEQLTKRRIEVFVRLKNELEILLQDIGMPDALIEIWHETVEPNNTGLDKIDILFSANKGVSPSLISKVASGGELSRLMFSIKYILADKTALPTIIFDEIDTGVSGEVALKMGRMMSAMAENHQVITITHLPQIAANAKSHYYVYKDEELGKTISKIKELDAQERLHEVATMIGGESPSEVSYSSAMELISKK